MCITANKPRDRRGQRGIARASNFTRVVRRDRDRFAVDGEHQRCLAALVNRCVGWRKDNRFRAAVRDVRQRLTVLECPRSRNVGVTCLCRTEDLPIRDRAAVVGLGNILRRQRWDLLRTYCQSDDDGVIVVSHSFETNNTLKEPGSREDIDQTENNLPVGLPALFVYRWEVFPRL